MTLINGYGVVSACGDSVEALWQALQVDPPAGEYLMPGPRPPSVRELLGANLLRAYGQFHLPAGRLGVILASTKGFTQDFVMEADAASRPDPLTGLLDDFLRASNLAPERSLCVSNACSSGLAALALAQAWLNQGLEHVLVLACDAVTPFVRQGFGALKLLSEEAPRPFDTTRAGFKLGEACAAMWVSSARTKDSVRLLPVGLDSEGSPVTRPSTSGQSLLHAASKIPGIPRARSCDIIITHGTGTRINDETEDLAFYALYEGAVVQPWLTGSKWRLGHTLGASSLVDTILACEILRREQSFALRTTTQIDPAFRARYLLRDVHVPAPTRVMISSLGFGGMHAVAVVEAPPEVGTW